jgi:hypothetical protein
MLSVTDAAQPTEPVKPIYPLNRQPSVYRSHMAVRHLIIVVWLLPLLVCIWGGAAMLIVRSKFYRAQAGSTGNAPTNVLNVGLDTYHFAYIPATCVVPLSCLDGRFSY